MQKIVSLLIAPSW